jgi:hypothetical protein
MAAIRLAAVRYCTLISIGLLGVDFVFGMCTVSTPSPLSHLMLLSSTSSGSVNLREKVPWKLSTR